VKRGFVRAWRAALATLIVAVGIGVAYVDSAPPFSPTGEPSCASAAVPGVRWVRVSTPKERATLDRWCSGVGPPTRIEATHPRQNFPASFVIVSWNMHVGGGDIDDLVADLRSGKLTGRAEADFILMLQEAYRDGDVPSSLEAAWAAAIKAVPLHRERVDIASAARRLGLWAVYIPSMRNGQPGATSEDRGNAILSTRSLDDVTAIELPLERQRRVAIAATARVSVDGAAAKPLRIVNTHFTNMVMHHLWILSESGRLRQARALNQVLPRDGALVVGGDFNAWFGFRDAAYRELAERMTKPTKEDRRATFGPLRLDHMLFRLPEGWRSELRRANDKYGSDHYPLVATIDAR
jgi:endonuclease/exonuclease/phosphatase family metal-dependent hydrolase